MTPRLWICAALTTTDLAAAPLYAESYAGQIADGSG
jgi:hypothetical protein